MNDLSITFNETVRQTILDVLAASNQPLPTSEILLSCRALEDGNSSACAPEDSSQTAKQISILLKRGNVTRGPDLADGRRTYAFVPPPVPKATLADVLEAINVLAIGLADVQQKVTAMQAGFRLAGLGERS